MARLKVEHALYTLTSNLVTLKALWGIIPVLCSVCALCVHVYLIRYFIFE